MKRSLLLQSCALAAAVAFTAPAWAADPPSGAASTTMQSSQIDAQKLLGQTVKNDADESLGKIDSVILDKDGKAAAVVVGVGGFLGMGEHDVALPWSSLRITDNGREVHGNFTKDQLKAMPAYRFADSSRRGTAFRDEAYRADRVERSDMTRSDRTELRPTTTPSMAQNNYTVFGSAGEIRASKLVGTDVVNAAGEKIGDISEVIINRNGSPQAIVSVGGFLGMGEHRVALDWSKLKIERQGNTDRMRVMLDMTKDQLKAQPEYKFEAQRG